MKFFPGIFTHHVIRPWPGLLFAAVMLTMFIPGGFPGHPYGPDPDALARESGLRSTPPESARNNLTSRQQQEIIEKNSRIRKLQEGIIDHKIKILGSRTRERTLLGELEKIENELRQQKKMLVELQQESAQQELLLSDKQEYLNQVLAAKKAHQAHVKNRLAAFYRMGTVGLMNVAFSSESLPELLDFQEYFSLMVQHDHEIIQNYLARLQESNRAREEHAREKLRLMKLAAEVSDKEEQLQQIREEKNILLKQVNTEQHLYEQAVLEIEEAAADLAVTLQRLQTAAAPEPAASQASATAGTRKKKSAPPPPADTASGFQSQKGLLDPPVEGLIYTRFGQKVEGRFNSSSIANGIDIRVDAGADIRAVYDGKIIHSGYLRGYGNLMIIDHGQQYFSLISRAAEFYKNEGTTVSAGEIIGVTGEGDPLYGEGLHFEIRRGSTPEDPLLWLKRDGLPFAASAENSR